MATKSIFKNIIVTDKESIKKLVAALEKAEQAKDSIPYKHYLHHPG